MKFLRGLKRHNDREWFEARRGVYEAEVRGPLLAVAEEISRAMETFAPEHVRPANKAAMRIYRDIRFSPDKRPYKTHVSAWWARRGMEKIEGAGFYLQVDPEGVMLAGGAYMPAREQTLALRRWMSEHHVAYRAQLKALGRPRGGRAGMVSIEGKVLTRMPKGFAADDPADELLRATSWGVRQTLEADAALEPGFAAVAAAVFKRCAGLVDTLNAAMAPASAEVSRDVRL